MRTRHQRESHTLTHSLQRELDVLSEPAANGTLFSEHSPALQPLRPFAEEGAAPLGASKPVLAFPLDHRVRDLLAHQLCRWVVAAPTQSLARQRRQLCLLAWLSCEEPLSQRYIRTRETDARGQRNLVAAAIALIQLAWAWSTVVRRMQQLALEALRPARLIERLDASLSGAEPGHDPRKRHPALELDSVHRHVFAPADLVDLPSTLPPPDDCDLPAHSRQSGDILHNFA